MLLIRNIECREKTNGRARGPMGTDNDSVSCSNILLPIFSPGTTGILDFGSLMADLPEKLEGINLGDRMVDIFSSTPGILKSMIISIVDLILKGNDREYSVKLLRHYMSGDGKAYEINPVPDEWQEWIVKQTRGRSGFHRQLKPYNSGIYDLRNSLGHFDVQVQKKDDRTEYHIFDTYKFGYRKNDKLQKGRHGFGIGKIDSAKIEWIKSCLPTKEYVNPGGFSERFEIKKVGQETILFIPWEFLQMNGKPFPVRGSFFKYSRKKK